ncbi:MAG: hypothetical protein K1X55_09795 [Chitinophagales bacterium]|nr:hypothetical protein [Chitinophagales bacterium]
MERPSVLFVSIAFPPKFDSEGLQVAKYFRYFSPACADCMDIDVVTSAIPTLFMPYDASLEIEKNSFRQKIDIPIFENKYVNFLLRKILPHKLDAPDSKLTFHWQWKKVVRQLKHKPAVIYSRSFPASSAVMAMKLKKYYQVPWILHLSDPWVDSPVNVMKGKVRVVNEHFEQECFALADKISLTSHETIDFYKNKYPTYQHKFCYYPNVYDPEDIPAQNNHPKNGKLKFVYTGGMAGTRSPEPFLKAFSTLPKVIQDNIEVVFSGWADRANATYFQQYTASCVRYIGHLATYKEAIALQNSADVLLLIDFPIAEPNKRMYFLSKVLDYMITGKYVLATTGKGSTCERIIQDKMGACYEEIDIEGLKNKIIWLVEQFKQGNDPIFFRNNVNPEFDAKENAVRLRDELLALTSCT